MNAWSGRTNELRREAECPSYPTIRELPRRPSIFRDESQELPLDSELKRSARGVIDQILQLRDSL